MMNLTWFDATNTVDDPNYSIELKASGEILLTEPFVTVENLEPGERIAFAQSDDDVTKWFFCRRKTGFVMRKSIHGGLSIKAPVLANKIRESLGFADGIQLSIPINIDMAVIDGEMKLIPLDISSLLV